MSTYQPRQFNADQQPALPGSDVEVHLRGRMQTVHYATAGMLDVVTRAHSVVPDHSLTGVTYDQYGRITGRPSGVVAVQSVYPTPVLDPREHATLVQQPDSIQPSQIQPSQPATQPEVQPEAQQAYVTAVFGQTEQVQEQIQSLQPVIPVAGPVERTPDQLAMAEQARQRITDQLGLAA